MAEERSGDHIPAAFGEILFEFSKAREILVEAIPAPPRLATITPSPN